MPFWTQPTPTDCPLLQKMAELATAAEAEKSQILSNFINIPTHEETGDHQAAYSKRSSVVGTTRVRLRRRRALLVDLDPVISHLGADNLPCRFRNNRVGRLDRHMTVDTVIRDFLPHRLRHATAFYPVTG